ncbi:Nitrogen permease regulator 2 [Pichia kudriavzevii]|nr:Nitrogen permease regulator 2 [Pichia kudriavzevii]
MDSVSSNPFNQKKQQPSVISLPSKATLFQLYNSLNSHVSVKQWYKDNAVSLEYIDVRKFITFGVRAGIIARVHSYPVSGKLSSLNVSDAIDLERREYNKNEFNASALPILSKPKADLLKPGLKNIDPTSEFTDCESETSTDDDEQDQEEGDVGRLDSDHDQFEDVLAEKRRRKEIKQEKTLLRLIRHNQHLDSICTTMELPNTEVFKILDRIGDIEIIDR